MAMWWCGCNLPESFSTHSRASENSCDAVKKQFIMYLTLIQCAIVFMLDLCIIPRTYPSFCSLKRGSTIYTIYTNHIYIWLSFYPKITWFFSASFEIHNVILKKHLVIFQWNWIFTLLWIVCQKALESSRRISQPSSCILKVVV